MYLRRLFSDKKIKLVNKNKNKNKIETQKTQVGQGRCCSKYCRRVIAKV